MEKKSFFRSTAFYIGTGILVVAFVAYLVLKDSKDDSDACFTIPWSELNDMLGEGWNEPGRENYTESIVFEMDEASGNLVIYPARNTDTACEQLKARAFTIDPSGADCELSEFKSSRYDLQASDIDPVTGRLFRFEDMQLERSSDTEYTFKMSYVGSTKITYTVPCPPYCPKPE